MNISEERKRTYDNEDKKVMAIFCTIEIIYDRHSYMFMKTIQSVSQAWKLLSQNMRSFKILLEYVTVKLT